MEDYILYVEDHSKCTSYNFESEATDPDDVSDDFTFWSHCFGHEDF
jgi:hypothetical protein